MVKLQAVYHQTKIIFNKIAGNHKGFKEFP